MLQEHEKKQWLYKLYNLHLIIIFEICLNVEKCNINRSKSYLNAVNTYILQSTFFLLVTNISETSKVHIKIKIVTLINAQDNMPRSRAEIQRAYIERKKAKEGEDYLRRYLNKKIEVLECIAKVVFDFASRHDLVLLHDNRILA